MNISHHYSASLGATEIRLFYAANRLLENKFLQYKISDLTTA